MTNRKRVAGGLVIILLACAMLCCIMAQIPQRVTAWAQTATSAWEFYNYRANANETHEDDHSFDRNTKNDNTYLDGENAVKAGTVASVLEYHITYDENTGKFGGELTRRENPATAAADPVLLASHCLHVEEVTGKVILVDEQGFAPQKRPEAAVDHFMEDRSYAQECYERLADVYRHATSVEVKEVYGYKNSHYMQPKGSHGVRPRLVVWPSTNAGGHMLVFHFADMPDIMYRIECGYQPIDVDYMDVPDVPPVPDNPPQAQVTPTPKPQNTPTPPPLEEKDPTQDYQHQHPDDPDVGGGKNHGSDTTVTDDPKPEQNSPSEYKAPDPPPKNESSNNGGGSNNSTPAGKDEASKGTKSGSKTADQDNGKKETYTDPGTGKKESGTVTAGDGGDHGDLAQHVDEHPATVEPTAGDNNGELAAPPE